MYDSKRKATKQLNGYYFVAVNLAAVTTENWEMLSKLARSYDRCAVCRMCDLDCLNIWIYYTCKHPSIDAKHSLESTGVSYPQL
uniref:Transposase n=1 Tax=Heterorhabditis bacteriophora TaxID=37862 RepID=A0A1I7WIS3_HETBA